METDYEALYQQNLNDAARGAMLTVVAKNHSTTVTQLREWVIQYPGMGDVTLAELVGSSASKQSSSVVFAKPAAAAKKAQEEWNTRTKKDRMSHIDALADLRVARLDAWSEYGHPHPERALFEDVNREAARQRAQTPAEKRAVSAMLKANEGLVKLHTRGYVAARPELADDIRQEARMGILRAIERYDFHSSAFSTYACLWMRCMVIIFFRQHGDHVRVPNMTHARRIILRLDRERHPDSTPVETAKRLGISLGVLHRLDNSCLIDSDLFVIADDESDIGIDLISFDDIDMDDLLDLCREYDIVDLELGRLPDRTRRVYHEIVVNERTLESVGKMIGVSRERTRQILDSAKNKIFMAILSRRSR